jgi:hypothetical protein
MKKTITIVSIMIFIFAIGANAIQIAIDCDGRTSSPGIDATTQCSEASPQAVISLYISDVQGVDDLDQLVARLDYDNALLLYSSAGLNTGLGRSEFMQSGGGTAIANGIAIDSNTIDVGAGIQGDCATAGTCPIGEGDVLKITFDCMAIGTVQCSGDTFTIITTGDPATSPTWWADPDGQRNLFEEEVGECTPGETRPCAKQQGVCSGTVETCTAGAIWPGCDYSLLPDYEDPEVSCDGLDNDCDGSIDEGVQNIYYQDSDSDNYGNPAVTVFACSAPVGYVSDNTDCNDGDGTVYPGADEVCDGKDNDCNSGTADGSEEPWYGDSCDGADSDLCEEGTYSCVAGSQSCSDSTGDNLEVCNGLDDDCDGSTDEDFTDLGDACTAGVGVCEASGTMVCTADETGTECDATPGSPTGADDNCNNIDEDCSGTADDNYAPDEGCFLPGVCAAENAASSCSAGVETSCQTGTPGTEVCEGSLDENCDGTVDEGCACTDGETQQCGTTDVGACGILCWSY